VCCACLCACMCVYVCVCVCVVCNTLKAKISFKASSSTTTPCACVYVWMYVSTYVCVVHACVRACVCVHVCVHVCVCVVCNTLKAKISFKASSSSTTPCAHIVCAFTFVCTCAYCVWVHMSGQCRTDVCVFVCVLCMRECELRQRHVTSSILIHHLTQSVVKIACTSIVKQSAHLCTQARLAVLIAPLCASYVHTVNVVLV